jgi:hypothetical protein
MMMRIVAEGAVFWGWTLGGGASVLGPPPVVVVVVPLFVPCPVAGVFWGFTPSLPLFSASVVGGEPGPVSVEAWADTATSSCATD